MIKSIVSFVKNLFGSKEPQQPEQQAPAAWPFPTSVPEDGPVQATVPAVIEDLPATAPVVSAAPVPKKRKRRAPKKTTTATPAAAVVAAPAEAVKETTKLSPGPSRRRKVKK